MYFCIHFVVITIGWLIDLIRIACKLFYLCLNVKNRVYCNDDDFVQWSGQFLYAQLNNSSAWQQTSSLFILLIFSRDHILHVSWEYHTRAYGSVYKVDDCRQTSGTRCYIGHILTTKKRDAERPHTIFTYNQCFMKTVVYKQTYTSSQSKWSQHYPRATQKGKTFFI